ncbi:unnamed protein product, partial [Iphiclides podalirius]
MLAICGRLLLRAAPLPPFRPSPATPRSPLTTTYQGRMSCGEVRPRRVTDGYKALAHSQPLRASPGIPVRGKLI